MAVALLVAAGRGERLGAVGPKAFVMLAGRPMIDWSLDALRAVAAIERIVVALPRGVAAPAGTIGVEGGAARSQSVRAALAAAYPGPPSAEDEAVLVHDAARPLATPELFARVLAELDVRGCDAALAATRVTDTVKHVGAGGVVEATLDRTALWAAQTPQAFRRSVLAAALTAPEEQLAAATDDAWLIERAGGAVHVVESPAENLKVTTPVDLRLAELLLSERC